MAPALRFKIIQDLPAAQKTWEQFSPQATVYDLWNFRYQFYQYDAFPLHFLVGYDGNKQVGVLPLQYNPEAKALEFFGGDYMEENQVFVAPGYESWIPQFIEQVKQPANLDWLKTPSTSSAVFKDYKYVLPLTGFTSYEDYINQYYSGKSKSKFKNKIKQLRETYPFTIREDCLEDLEWLVRKNKENFGETSLFHQPFRQKILAGMGEHFTVKMLTLLLQDQIAAVSFAIVWKQTYVGSDSATNKQINNLGKVLILEKINQAIRSGATLYDARGPTFAWKQEFHLTPIPLYQILIS